MVNYHMEFPVISAPVQRACEAKVSYVPLYCDCRLPELYENLVAYDHGFIISVSVTIIVKIGFVKIISKLMLLFSIHLLRFLLVCAPKYGFLLLCIAQSKDCAYSYIARNVYMCNVSYTVVAYTKLVHIFTKRSDGHRKI